MAISYNKKTLHLVSDHSLTMNIQFSILLKRIIKRGGKMINQRTVETTNETAELLNFWTVKNKEASNKISIGNMGNWSEMDKATGSDSVDIED
jgi:hypothetical protein